MPAKGKIKSIFLLPAFPPHFLMVKQKKMKRIFLALLFLHTHAAFSQSKQNRIDSLPADSFYMLAPASVRAVRADENAPFSKSNLTKKDINLLNQGVDLPSVLGSLPSVVIHSDAGNGIGYTGLRIRGTDATRINITLNGIPFNDAESQGTFFVNLPDFISSASSIQVQRGVGTSSNGAGAFGASVNISTLEREKEKYIELNNSIGSFNSRKHTLKFSTGTRKGFFISGRLSSIQSDGFIDRARSDLKAFYVSTGYSKDSNSIIRLNIFSGKEKTYQAWYGISETDLLAGNRRINYAGTEKPGSPYENETDNYQQTHYQFFWEKALRTSSRLSTAFFITRGKGYYEQYKADQKYSTYGLTPPLQNGVPITTADFIRQLWLDNYFYGNTTTLSFKKNKTDWTLGGTISHYLGNHFGKLIWSSNSPLTPYTWYQNKATKKENALFVRQQSKINSNWVLFYDLQFRAVNYTIDGFRNNPTLHVNASYLFFNPKVGITYRKQNWKSFLSYSRGAKEPNRDDFEAGVAQLSRPEKLGDLEIGVEKKTKRYQASLTFYYMHYKDQLVLTGKINDVGAYTRTNIPQSSRTGVEVEGELVITNWLKTGGNFTWSRNRIKNLEEYIDDYDNGGQVIKKYGRSALAFSPSLVTNHFIRITPFKNFETNFSSRYVSSQFLDNTSNSYRILKAFLVNDLRTSYSWSSKRIKEVLLIGQINNIFNRKYEPNGYTFSYIYGGSLITENYYFPMANRNFMLTLNLKF
jgi:iron complex outermembrane receptor protein